MKLGKIKMMIEQDVKSFIDKEKAWIAVLSHNENNIKDLLAHYERTDFRAFLNNYFIFELKKRVEVEEKIKK